MISDSLSLNQPEPGLSTPALGEDSSAQGRFWLDSRKNGLVGRVVKH